MKLLRTIGGTAVWLAGSIEAPIVSWTGKADIDNDGPDGNPEHDPDHQNTTSLRHPDGSFINSETEFGIVIPESLIRDLKPAWLGSQSYVTYNKKTAPAVVYDFGPANKIGEISVCLARFLGIDLSATKEIAASSGVHYEVHVGTPAVVGDKKYSLQPV